LIGGGARVIIDPLTSLVYDLADLFTGVPGELEEPGEPQALGVRGVGSVEDLQDLGAFAIGPDKRQGGRVISALFRVGYHRSSSFSPL
jgi:hypothetical protein